MNHDQTPTTKDGKVLLVLISEYADWEPALLSAGLRRGFGLWEPRYTIASVSLTDSPIKSIGGLTVLPDYTIESAPSDFSALILIGGTNWFSSETEKVLPLIKIALERKAVLGGICDGSMFLGTHGFLNHVNHTSNNLALLKEKAGSKYKGESLYHADQQSVLDGNIVTANGVGFIEFARDVFTVLDVAPKQKIDEFYKACKTGFYKF